MTQKAESYTGIDFFRMIAALLVVAIHTSPLSSVSETGNFILTRIVGRVAVPFFMMTSGFFLISRYACNDERLKKFVKKTVLIYAAAIVLYIPINVYNDYFAMEYLLPNLIKDFLFDGTLYHLWYLPASVFGAAIAWVLVRKFDFHMALLVSFMLYIIGLFGDSYFGISEKIPVLNGCYQMIFQVSDYTRNGIFYAPVFFVLGGLAAQQQERIQYERAVQERRTAKWEKYIKNVSGFIFSFVLLLIEALLLRRFEMQRHDSMYLFLLPCTYFLFCILLCWRGKRIGWIRSVSLTIYIIHPMMIVVLRMIAKLFGLQKVLVENSIIHYVAVCITSALAAFLFHAVKAGTEKRSIDTDRAWIEINLDNLTHNVNVLRQEMQPGCELMAVVKAEGYGHGAFEISTHLEKMGVNAFAVATIDEGIKLRKYGIRGEILILGYTNVRRARELKKYNLMQTVIDFGYAKALDRQGIPIKAHIKIDTGMHRLGIAFDAPQKVRAVFSMRNIKVCGIYTHLCCADSLLPEDEAFTRKQISCFYHLINALEKSNLNIPKVHIQSSYGLLNYPELQCDYARIGIALYGVLSTPFDDTVLKPDLRPVLSLKSKVILVKTIQQGEYVGYGREFVAERDSRIAILPVGYADGYPRNLSCGRGNVLINQQEVPVIGRICMDQLAVDVTDVENISIGAVATLINAQPDGACTAPEVAEWSGSISNELLSRMGERVVRIPQL